MKKFLSIIICIVISVMGIVPAFATETPKEVTMTTFAKNSLTPGEVIRLECKINNPNEAMGAKMNLYLDGQHIVGGGSEYFVIDGETVEYFEFMVPHNIDALYQHNLLAELICDNGQGIYCSNIFTVDAIPANVTMTTFMNSELVTGEIVKVYCDILNPGKPMGAKLTLFIDSIPLRGSGSPYFVIDGVNNENFDFTVPADLDPYYEHNLLVELICDNGQVIYCSNMFKLTDKKSYGSSSEISALVIPATINYDVKAYQSASLTGYVTTIPKGTVVEYMNPDNHNSMSKARVRLLDSGTVCWVPMSAVYISQEDYTIEDTLTDADREGFVNGAGYSSKTSYLIWVNKQRQRLTVFMGSQGNWKALKTFPVATGKNSTPTPTTVCEYTQYQRWNTATYVCDPVLYFYDGYAIHNQPVSHSGKVIDTTIGKPASAGCIRMLIDDVRWVYAYVPVGTTVVLY